MRTFKKYRDFRSCAVDNGLQIKTDHKDNYQIAYAIINGPGGVVLIGQFDHRTHKGHIAEEKIAIAKRGMQPGDWCVVEHMDEDGDVNPYRYRILKTAGTNRYVDAPVLDDNLDDVEHTSIEECFRCVNEHGREMHFRCRDCDPG